MLVFASDHCSQLTLAALRDFDRVTGDPECMFLFRWPMIHPEPLFLRITLFRDRETWKQIGLTCCPREQLAGVVASLSAMSKPRRSTASRLADGVLFAAKRRKVTPHEFVLDAIAPLSPWTRRMFGCLAVYVEDKIVLVLRDKRENAADNGVWLATTTEHHESLRREFPNMRSIQVLRKKVTGWQVLPADASDFEEAAMHACELIIARDPRIGKVPGARRTSGSRTKKAIRSFPDDTLAVLRASKGLRIRAGTGRHRFIGIWVVVVRDRVFVRSWSAKPNGWYRTFLKEPRGSIQVADYEIAVHAKCIQSERLRDEIDRAYLEKYNTAGALKYARDLGRAKSRATTIELVPLPSTN